MSRPSLSFFSDQALPEPCQSSNQNPFFNQALIAFISGKMQAQGLDDMGLAKLLKPSNPSSVFFLITDFFKTGRLKPSLLERLPQALGFERQELSALQDSFANGIDQTQASFAAALPLLLKNEELINRRQEYRNTVFPGLSFSGGVVNRHLPLTLGEILFHYRSGALIAHDLCCGPVYLFSIHGSVLSGSNKVSGACPACGKIVSGYSQAFGKALKAILYYQPPFPYAVSPLGLEDLISELS